MEEEKEARREAARAAGKDETTLNFDNLPNHDPGWSNIVNDLTFVLELAQGWPVPGESTSTPDTTAVTPTRKKRAAEQDEGSSRRKKKSS